MERNDRPKWPKEKDSAYLATFLFELATFMMRIGLMVFAHPTIKDMPALEEEDLYVLQRIPCKRDKCGKDNHSTAYHDIYERIVNKNKKRTGNVSCVLQL